MTVTLVAALVALALVDSTSFGTLLIPIWLLLAPGRLRAGRIAVYLATVATFYLGVGILLVLGADAALEAVGSIDIPPVPLRIGQLVLGALVIALSYRLEARAAQRAGRPGNIQLWRSRTMSGTGSAGSLMKLALVAAALEVATMLPYLAAVGLLANADLAWHLIGITLAGYCIVMTLPAIALALARFALHQRVDPFLQRINEWLSRNSAKALGWTVGGIGIGIILNAAIALVVAPT